MYHSRTVKMTSYREEIETIKVLRQLERTRNSDYVWTREELAKVAPHYNGSPQRFNISQHIQSCIRFAEAKRYGPSTSGSRTNIIDDDVMSLDMAIRTVFHAICPHPVRYYGANREINFEEFNVDLALWLSTVSATWITMQDTQHDNQCKCCVSFRMIATNYKEMFQRTMSEDDYLNKRVAKNAIRRWASGISSEGAKEGLESLVKIGKALMSNAEDDDVSDLSDYSSELSDAQDGEASKITHISEEQRSEMQLEREMESDTETPLPVNRKRKIATRPLDTVIELEDRGGILTLAITEVDRAVHVRIPKQSYTEIGRCEMCNLAKNFFRQLIKVRSLMATYELRTPESMIRQIRKWDRAYYKGLSMLRVTKEEKETVYITRSRKRVRANALHNDGR